MTQVSSNWFADLYLGLIAAMAKELAHLSRPTKNHGREHGGAV